ncbi:MAG TPA: family 16 glycosylhydrolase, partial [Rariglobus sp.]
MTLSLFPRFLAVACLLTTPAVFSQEQIAPTPPASAAGNPKNVTTPEVFDALAFDITRRGTPLDLSGCRQTFFDGFDTLSVSAPGGPDARWFGPVHGGFGKAKFLPPGPDGPFSMDNGNLIITARKDERGWWTSGLIESVDRDGKRGFSQQYGYFEMRAEFPAGEGSWPAFWLKAVAERGDRTLSRPEIDIVEWYGG